ncbi:hypothetical protein RDWZM_007592 [Blomia tropicalis]|uniref:Nascent polypeptide-associated complex subunit alpha-like UBA domain-containing protein n=1 Tax=Blomia tropicalis TaxID=40697 RepID=A0A9Q0LZE8_BLOTA|nr:hypothetical protein RDWZM_007592 [Blomia tropicalis]
MPNDLTNIQNKRGNNEEDDIIEEDESQKKVVGKHDTGAADLAKVTNYGFFDEEGQGDPSTKEISGAMSIIDSKRSKEDAERVARQRELAKVTIRKEDLDLIMHEMEISKSEAELKLRQAMGDVVQALVTIINE